MQKGKVDILTLLDLHIQETSLFVGIYLIKWR